MTEGSVVDGEWLRGEITALGFSISGFGRLMIELGDQRPLNNILRMLQRMLAGDARVSGEMRVLIAALHLAQSVGAVLPGSRREISAAMEG